MTSERHLLLAFQASKAVHQPLLAVALYQPTKGLVLQRVDWVSNAGVLFDDGNTHCSICLLVITKHDTQEALSFSQRHRSGLHMAITIHTRCHISWPKFFRWSSSLHHYRVHSRAIRPLPQQTNFGIAVFSQLYDLTRHDGTVHNNRGGTERPLPPLMCRRDSPSG